MSEGQDLRAVGSRIEELLGRIRSAGDPATAETAEEIVRLVVELYGAGLERTVELAGPEVLERLVEDGQPSQLPSSRRWTTPAGSTPSSSTPPACDPR